MSAFTDWYSHSEEGCAATTTIQISEGANEVLISLDCTDYLGPFTTLLEGKMAVAFSSYSVGEDNYIDDTCGVSNSNST